MIQLFNNIGKEVIVNPSCNERDSYDLKVINKNDAVEEIKAFSLSRSEVNTVLKSYVILNNRRFKGEK